MLKGKRSLVGNPEPRLGQHLLYTASIESESKIAWAHIQSADHCSPEYAVGRDEAEANAVLMAASPDLLEALEAALEWMLEAEKETGKPIGEGMGYRAKMMKPVIVDKILCAIQKAKGE